MMFFSGDKIQKSQFKLIITYAGKYRELKLAGKVVFCRWLIINAIKNLCPTTGRCPTLNPDFFMKFGCPDISRICIKFYSVFTFIFSGIDGIF